MSIRVKILMILVLGMLVALTVSTLAFLNAQRLDTAIETLLTDDLGALRTVTEARESLHDARRTEDLIVAWRDASLKGDYDRAITTLLESVDGGQQLAADVGTSDTYREIRQRTELYQGSVGRIVDHVRDGGEQLSERRSALAAASAELREELAAVESSLTESTPAPDISESGEKPARVAEHLSQFHASLDRLLGTDFAIDFATTHAESLSAEVRRKISDVREKKDTLDGDFSELGRDESELGDDLDSVIEKLNGLLEVTTSQVGSVVNERKNARQTRSEIELRFTALSRSAWIAIEQRRDEMSEQRNVALSLIFTILIGGVALVLVLGVVLTRTTTQSFDQLLDAASDVQQGNFNTRVRIAGRDELQRLGMAFNGMARYLRDQRARQIDYNDIVTLLNSSLSTDEIMEGSLREIVIRSGSAVGAFYAADDGGEAVTLATGFGLSPEMSERRQYRLGSGLVGQAAKNRRKILVSPVPEGAFLVDTGIGTIRPDAVLILPVVHVDSLLGVLVLVTATPYPEDTVTFIEEVVFQFGVAYSNARFVSTIESTARILRERTEELIRQRATLENVNRELEAADRLKSDFLANVTHELRTPLNSIIGFTELVLDRDDLEPKPRRHLETALRNARHLLGLINDLLDITKIESGSVSYQVEAIDLGTLIEECLQTVSPMVERDVVALESRIERDLGAIATDPGKLAQVLINLLSNAAKFTDEGAIRVDARGLPDGQVEIAVMDTGIGIHAEDLPFIFDKFRQVDGSSSRRYGGTGLGLAITSELVHVLGGTITAKSEPGAGSTFIVVLPRTAELLDERPPQAGPKPRIVPVPAAVTGAIAALPSVPTLSDSGSIKVPSEAKRTPKRGRTDLIEVAPPQVKRPITLRDEVPPELEPGAVTERTILVVDDIPTTVVALRSALVNDGFEIKSAFIFADAVEAFDTYEPSALIIGRALPEDDLEATLIEFARRAHAAEIPVIALAPGVDVSDRLGLRPLATLDRPIDAERVLGLLDPSSSRA